MPTLEIFSGRSPVLLIVMVLAVLLVPTGWVGKEMLVGLTEIAAAANPVPVKATC
jgi:hypothetical protein